MARKIRFGLELKDGYKASDSIEEIREHFDYAKLVEYFLNGKLKQWLEDRHYESEAIELSALKPDASDFKERLCYIFKVDSKSSAVDKMIVDDMEKIKKRDLVRQYTSDEDVLNNIETVATTQEELENLCKQKSKVIYLCGKDLSISPEYENVTYVGLGNVTVSVDSDCEVNFTEKNIMFINIGFGDNYINLCKNLSIEYEDNDDNYSDVGKKDDEVDYNLVIAEMLACFVNGKMKNGDSISDVDIRPCTGEIPYDNLRDISSYKSIDSAFFREFKEEIIENNDKVMFFQLVQRKILIITLQAIRLIDTVNWRMDKCEFSDIKEVIERSSGRIDVYGEKGSIYLEKGFVIYTGLKPYLLRLFILVMGNLCSNLKYGFTESERSLLKNIYLEQYQGNIMDLLENET